MPRHPNCQKLAAITFSGVIHKAQVKDGHPQITQIKKQGMTAIKELAKTLFLVS